MNTYITGSMIKQLRESKELTQAALAEQIGVSSKAVSKWETAKGLPDITLLEPLAKALDVSVMELITGQSIQNNNVSCNMLRTRIYVCPVCGNVIHATGDIVISCCGIPLPALEADLPDNKHQILVEKMEDEHFVKVSHAMSKSHYISFIAYVTYDRFCLTKLYPEGNPETHFQFRGHGYLYIYCNKHGLLTYKI